MNRQGPGGQSVRGMPAFPTQQAQPTRATSRGAGSQAGWGFGMQNGGAQGLGASQGRTVGQSTFAQSIGGGQSQGPLDPLDFPSLGGSSHSQFQNSGQAVWNQRQGQLSAMQRVQQGQGGGASQHLGDDRGLDDAFFSGGAGDVTSSLDDYRHGGQGGLGQLSASGQQQPSSVDEFPPLGRRGHGVDASRHRRMNIMQNAAGGGFPGGAPFSSQPGSRGPSGSLIHLADASSGSGMGLQNGASDSASYGHDMGPQATAAVGRGSSQQAQQLDTGGPIGSRAEIGSGGNAGGAAAATQDASSQPALAARDRYGLRGLLDNIRSGDANNLAIGIDLNSLGLDLNASDPLYPTFGGPFAQGPARPLLPDFTLPTCYSVGNVHPLEEKIASVTDETLFWMFYNVTRDVAQELAAAELTNRTWRYHKTLRMWITKEPGYSEPQALNSEMERGRYVVFNTDSWRRESREMIIRYQDLDDHITPALGPSGMA